ncbi:MAG TPA: efflux RND transporter permease subunit, partial [Longimicrobiales bacterium]
PDTELPQLTVSAQWPGASPETVEAFLTAPLEAVLQQVRSVERIESTSEEASARITLEFDADADMQFVRLDLSERLAALEGDLPEGVRGPFVAAYVPEEFADQARSFMRYTVTGPLTLETLREIVDTAIAPALRDVDGVAEVVAAGGRRRILEVELDDAKARALGLAPDDVRAAIASLEMQRAGGAIEQQGLQRPLALRAGIESAQEILDVPVVADGRRLVRLRDVAVVHDTYEEARSHYRVDGRPAVTFEVFRAPGTNVVAVADAVRAQLADLATPLPAGVSLILDEDQSEAIRTQMSDLRFRALIGAGVVFVVLLLFLRSIRSAVVVFATIAFSILLTLNLIYFGGLTLNMLTLMGLAMGFGLIDDNAIVVLESVHRRWKLGEAPLQAAERGARDVLLPVVAATATTAVVVIPFVWLQGELRAYYLPLAIVVGFAMIASLLVSFTFVPALAARLLPHGASGVRRQATETATGSFPEPAGPPSLTPDARRLTPQQWASIPRFATRHPWPVIVGALLLVGGSFWIFDKHVPRGVIWTNWWNERSWISITIELPRGAEIARTDEYARFFEERLARTEGIRQFVTTVTPRNARIEATFPDSLEGTSLPLVVKEELTALSHQFGGATVEVYGIGPSFYGGGASPPNYAIEVLGYNYAMVRDIAEDLGRRLQRFSRVRDVDTNASGRWFEHDRATEVVLRLDRARLAANGLSARDVVGHVVREAGGGVGGQVLLVGGDERTLLLRSAGARDADVLDLEQSLVRADGGAEVRLGAVASFEEREVMSRIVREDQQYQRIVAYEFRGPTKLGDLYRDAVVEATALPAGFALELDSRWTWDTEEQKQIWLVVAAALALVFMVTAALFESLRQPFIVLLTVPMAMTGVFVTFWLMDASFTREAYVGSIMMAGIVVNNSILLVDRYNQLAREGLAVRGAAAQAAIDRAQPILMTTATTVLGMLPLVLFSEAADANIWNAIGYALIGGLVSSTLLVLTVTPALLVVLRRRGADNEPVPDIA